MANCTNLRLVDGGSEIKQGDFSSVFSFALLDENKKAIDSLNGKNAVVVLSKDGVTVFKKSVVVSENSVKFTIDKVLEAGVYLLEIFCDGYVFPSNNGFRITVIKSIFSEKTLNEFLESEENTENTENTENIKNSESFSIDGMNLFDFYSYIQDIYTKIDNVNFVVEKNELANLYTQKIKNLIIPESFRNTNRFEDTEIFLSKEDIKSIKFYYSKLKEINITEKPNEILSSIKNGNDSYIFENLDIFNTVENRYNLFANSWGRSEKNDGNFYFAVKTRKDKKYTWEIEQETNVASIYLDAVIDGGAMGSDYIYINDFNYYISNNQIETFAIIKHDPNINEKGSFTIKATNTETGEVLTREFRVA